jgi:integrase
MPSKTILAGNSKPLKIKLTDAQLAKWRADRIEQEYVDTIVPGLRARAYATGKITFVLYKRMPGEKSPSRHKLGEWSPPGFTLADAREEARKWIGKISSGVSPKAEIEERKAASHRQSQETLNAAIDTWARFKVKMEGRCEKSTRRRVLDLERDVSQELGNRSLLELSRSREEIKKFLIEHSERKGPKSANRLHLTLASIFSWAIDENLYEIEINPCRLIRTVSYGYKRDATGRPFTDEEIRALWRAASLATYPWGDWFKFMCLTASRNGEATVAHWAEVDFNKKVWIIPPEHAKGGKSDGVSIRKPLSDAAVDILRGLPRDMQTVAGMGVHGNVLRYYDPQMVFGLKELDTDYGTQACRKSPKAVIAKHLPKDFPRWKFHWLRKTYRTTMSAHLVSVPEVAIELFMGHHQKDAVKAAYDYHQYESEMRRAAQIWADHIRRVVGPPKYNVLPFQKKTA